MSLAAPTLNPVGGMPWNPMHALERIGQDHILFDNTTRVAIIRQVTITRPTGTLWRSVTANQDPTDRTLIGYFPSLEMSVHVTWKLWVQRHQPAEEQHV